MSSTVLYDFVSGVSRTVVEKTMRETSRRGTTASDISIDGSFGSHLYSPARDPYYVSNLDSPVDEFIVEALRGTKFTNVVNIVLESVRADVYPYQEGGMLDQYIHDKVPLADAPITTQTVSPFVASLANHTLQWNNTWSLCPFTHKAMLGSTPQLVGTHVTHVGYCGQMPLPLDFSTEFEEPAINYQTCLPRVLRQLHSVTSFEEEALHSMNHSSNPTSDTWETTHVASFTGQWDHTKLLLEYAGFGTVIDAEFVQRARGKKSFDHYMGYYDEGMNVAIAVRADGVDSMEYFWKYVDATRSRTPRNRMYLSWMSQVTHWGVPRSPAWDELHYQKFTKDESIPDLINNYLNGIRSTDDIVKEIILGFRERGLEDDTLFVMYPRFCALTNAMSSHGDHGFPFLSKWQTPVENPHNDPYRISFMLYNPLISNPTNHILTKNVYGAAIPTTILDVLLHTNSLSQETQRSLAHKFAANYEHAQSFLRPIKPSIRLFYVNPGGSQWVLDNGRNLRV
jgi:Sulfatase